MQKVFAWQPALPELGAVNPYAPGGEYWWFAMVMSFVFGITWGSFFNVYIYRVPVKKSVVQPGSHCYHCGTYLKWYDNIPLLSYLLLRGNCRSCGTHFSARYFMVELLTGVMFVGLFARFGFDWALPFHLVVASMLLLGVFTDIDHFILPDGLTLGGAAFAIVVAAVLGRHAAIADDYAMSRDFYFSFVSPNRLGEVEQVTRLHAVAWSVACALFGYGLLAGVGIMGRLMFQKEAMGGGDIKLFAFLGAYLGALNCVWILFLSALLGAAIGLTLILTHKLLRKDEFEDLVLSGGSTVKLPWQTAEFPLPRERREDVMLTIADSVTDDEQPKEGSGTSSSQSTPADIILKIARRTSRQMHHFPYGPYIAVAAILVLLFQDQIIEKTREFLMLPI